MISFTKSTFRLFFVLSLLTLSSHAAKSQTVDNSSKPVDTYFQTMDYLYDFETQRIVLALSDNLSLVFADKVPLVYIPQTNHFIKISTPAAMKEGRLRLPDSTLDFIHQELKNLGYQIQMPKITEPTQIKLKDFEREVDPDKTQYTLKFSQKVQPEIIWANKWLHLDFNHKVIGAKEHTIRYKVGQVRRFTPTDKTFKWETNHLVGQATTAYNQDSTELNISFWRPGKSPQELLEAEEAKLRAKNPSKLRNIIIDAGHGGKDVGALGLKTNEKTITLKVAKQLKKALKKAGYNALNTRDNDKFLTLTQRPALAKKWKGDLFISLHCNSIAGDKKRRSKVKGFKIYILRETSDKKDKELAKRENKFLKDNSETQKSISIVEWIKIEHQLNLYTKKSEDFASHIVRALEQNKHNIRKHGSGAGQAGFYVLVGTFMPAVLVEMGFISNPEDEKYMMSSRGSKKIAELITQSVISYDKTLK